MLERKLISIFMESERLKSALGKIKVSNHSSSALLRKYKK